MARSKGSEFEKITIDFFKKIFEECGFIVLEARRQWSGTQNGFDVKITFLDDDSNERTLFFECKDYESELDWGNILQKVLELESANYKVDGFVSLSPKVNISNINDNVQAMLENKFEFPIKHWTPDSGIADMFTLDELIYRKIYSQDCLNGIDRKNKLSTFKCKINLILKDKDALRFTNRIQIPASTEKPVEDANYVTTLDKKLDSVFERNDDKRLQFHQLRCDYKVYLEKLTDTNNTLRTKIINWQDNLRLKAQRLTGKFNTVHDYTPQKYFYDFFDAAEKELLTFLNTEKLGGDSEKLLYGVIFELAAECPLDWRRN